MICLPDLKVRLQMPVDGHLVRQDSLQFRGKKLPHEELVSPVLQYGPADRHGYDDEEHHSEE